ncbi:hypothetical protein ANTPLA_LOCUS10182 [Anthophora plagiata]
MDKGEKDLREPTAAGIFSEIKYYPSYVQHREQMTGVKPIKIHCPVCLRGYPHLATILASRTREMFGNLPNWF